MVDLKLFKTTTRLVENLNLAHDQKQTILVSRTSSDSYLT